jgi:hypothetical protein
MNALSLKPYSEQIYLSKATLMETCLVVGDDLVEVVLVLLIEFCEELGAFGCPIRLAHSQRDLKTNLFRFQPIALDSLVCGCDSAATPPGSLYGFGRICECLGVLPEVEVRGAQVF